MTVVFITGMSVFNVLFLGYLNQSSTAYKSNFLGASVNILEKDSEEDNILYFGSAGLEANNPVDVVSGMDRQETRFIIVDGASLLNVNNPLSNVLPTREGLMIYKIQKGDNLSRIAANFGISLNTILWANNDLKIHAIQPGQEIVILPVTGVLHQVQEGETLENISSQYNVPIERVLNANPNLIPAKLSGGSTIIIPDTRPLKSNFLLSSNLPNLQGYFAIPTTGWNWGRLHNNNAVDIANACGTPIYAAAEGLVVEAFGSGWNDGYGNYILVEHPNGTKTKYAHNSKNLVSVGDYVLKGDQIGLIGNTGLTHGPTGCHLHFEVKGARNPFAK